MATAELVDGEIQVKTNWREHKLVEQVPGLNHRSRDDVWHGTPSWALCVTLRGVFGNLLEVGDELKRWSWRQWNAWLEGNMNLRTRTEGISDDDDSPEAKVIRSWR